MQRSAMIYDLFHLKKYVPILLLLTYIQPIVQPDHENVMITAPITIRNFSIVVLFPDPYSNIPACAVFKC